MTLLESDLTESLGVLLRQYGVPSSWIEIEITETVGEMERETIAQISRRIKREGFQISLDDFGSKYTSISMLTVMKFDVLKLDRSLVSDLVSNPDNQTVVQCVIDMCRRMKIRIIAEGWKPGSSTPCSNSWAVTTLRATSTATRSASRRSSSACGARKSRRPSRGGEGVSASWNPWHGCRKISPGCAHCYVYRIDGRHGKSGADIVRTAAYDLPLRKSQDGSYKIPPGETVYTCFTSDFLLPEADAWRNGRGR